VVDLSPAKILVVLVVALVVLGPDKLPRVARQAGRLVNDFRRLRDGVHAEVREAFGDPSALSNLQNLSSLSNLPARGRAWVTSMATGPPSSTSQSSGSASSGNPPATAPPVAGVPFPGPPAAGGVSPGHPPGTGRSPGETPQSGNPDGGSPRNDGGFEARFN
jgi:sec-independent protein translocase protein TatB